MESPVYLTKSAFAAHRGVSPGYVTKLKDQGRLVMAPDGKRIDVIATEALLIRTADPSKTSVADRHQKVRVDKEVIAYVAPDAPSTTPPHPAEIMDFQKAKARREHFLGQLAENEARKSSGELVARQAVEDAAFASGRMLRDLLLGLPKQISPGLSAISDPWELERVLTGHLRRVLDDASRLSMADLEQALQPPN